MFTELEIVIRLPQEYKHPVVVQRLRVHGEFSKEQMESFIEEATESVKKEAIHRLYNGVKK
jgi:hypothetical protein